jgi:putative transposase
MHQLRKRVCLQAGRNPDPTFAIIDSQSVKTVQKGGQRGYDGSNKIKGRKRHIAVDTMGWPLAVAVHSAGISDTRGAHLVLLRLFLVLPQLLKFLLDGGYKQGLIEWSKAMFGYIIEVVKRPQLHIFKLLPSGGTLS